MPEYANLAEELKAKQQEEYLRNQGIVRDQGAYLDTNTASYVTDPVQAARNQVYNQNVQQFGLMSQGGGPVTLATPENVQRFGLPTAYAGPNAGELGSTIQQQESGTQFNVMQRGLQNRRQQLINQLPYANRHQARGIAAEIQGINENQDFLNKSAAMRESQRRFDANQRRLLAHDDVEHAARMIKLDRETSIDEQGSALMMGLGRLDAAHRNGQISGDEYDAGLLDLGQANQLGLHHPVAGKMYEHFVTEADKRNAFNVRRLTSETAKLAARYGVEPQIDPDTGLPSLELTKGAALQTDKGRGELFKQMNDEMLQKYGVPTGITSLFNPIEPHTESEGGKSINLPFLDKNGEVKHLAVPKPMFEQMKADFNDRYFAINPQQKSDAQPAVGLQVGATRNVGGQNYAWNGTRWEPQ